MDMQAPVAASRMEPAQDADPTAELVELGFDVATTAALQPAVNTARVVSYEPGETIYHEGSEIEALYVNRSGRIKLVNYLENGRARIVRLHNRGSVIGLNGLLGEPHAHTAAAIDDVTLFHIPMHLLRPIKEQDPEVYCRLLEYWNEYLSTADTWITDFSTGTVRGRLARLVRFLVEYDEDTGPHEVTLLTVEEMAEILGVTPESVSRHMAELKRRKIVQPVTGELANRYRCDMRGLLREAEK